MLTALLIVIAFGLAVLAAFVVGVAVDRRRDPVRRCTTCGRHHARHRAN
ncbi:hypothetical protein GCM10020367_20670 [Streptomyces sannanensis]|uniref:Uncharacterized protein n=1 Tax=Streptomyces sannanensis TaxID=285536 RepID=A0ABP6S8Y5_9ACTN